MRKFLDKLKEQLVSDNHSNINFNKNIKKLYRKMKSEIKNRNKKLNKKTCQNKNHKIITKETISNLTKKRKDLVFSRENSCLELNVKIYSILKDTTAKKDKLLDLSKKSYDENSGLFRKIFGRSRNAKRIITLIKKVNEALPIDQIKKSTKNFQDMPQFKQMQEKQYKKNISNLMAFGFKLIKNKKIKLDSATYKMFKEVIFKVINLEFISKEYKSKQNLNLDSQALKQKLFCFIRDCFMNKNTAPTHDNLIQMIRLTLIHKPLLSQITEKSDNSEIYLNSIKSSLKVNGGDLLPLTKISRNSITSKSIPNINQHSLFKNNRKQNSMSNSSKTASQVFNIMQN